MRDMKYESRDPRGINSTPMFMIDICYITANAVVKFTVYDVIYKVVEIG